MSENRVTPRAHPYLGQNTREGTCLGPRGSAWGETGWLGRVEAGCPAYETIKRCAHWRQSRRRERALASSAWSRWREMAEGCYWGQGTRLTSERWAVGGRQGGDGRQGGSRGGPGASVPFLERSLCQASGHEGLREGTEFGLCFSLKARGIARGLRGFVDSSALVPPALGWVLLWGGGCCLHCQRSSRIPCLSPLRGSSTSCPDNPKHSSHRPMRLWGQQCPGGAAGTARSPAGLRQWGSCLTTAPSAGPRQGHGEGRGRGQLPIGCGPVTPFWPAQAEPLQCCPADPETQALDPP